MRSRSIQLRPSHDRCSCCPVTDDVKAIVLVTTTHDRLQTSTHVITTMCRDCREMLAEQLPG